MAADGFRESAVRLSGDLDRFFAFELFDPRLRQQHSLHVDARRIHRGDPAIAELEGSSAIRVRQPPACALGALLEPAAGTIQKGGRREVLLKGDRAH